MKMKISISSKKMGYSLFEYLLTLILVLECRSIYNNINLYRDTFGNRMLYGLLATTLGCIVFKRSLSKENVQWVGKIWGALLLYLIGYVFFNGYNVESFARLFLAIVILVAFYGLCCRGQNFPTVFEKYINIVTIIAAVSLFFWLFGSTLKWISPTGTVLMNWTGSGEDISYATYYNLYYEVQTIEIGAINAIQYRNTAIFVEAPMFALHLSLAIMMETLLKKPSKFKILLMGAGIVTTFSTTGYIMLLLIFVHSFLLSKNRNLKKFLILLAPMVAVTAGVLAVNLLSTKLGNLSGLTRIDDFIVGWNIWKSNFLMGVGYDNYRYVQSMMSGWRAFSLGMSSSLMMVVSYGGIYFLAPYLGCYIAGFRRSHQRRFFTALLLLLWIVTVFPFQYILIFLCMYIASKE